MQDPMKGVTRVNYGASGVGQCLPIRTIELASDITIFRHGTLTAGTIASAFSRGLAVMT